MGCIERSQSGGCPAGLVATGTNCEWDHIQSVPVFGMTPSGLPADTWIERFEDWMRGMGVCNVGLFPDLLQKALELIVLDGDDVLRGWICAALDIVAIARQRLYGRIQ